MGGNSYTTVNCAKFLPFHYMKLRSLRSLITNLYWGSAWVPFLCIYTLEIFVNTSFVQINSFRLHRSHLGHPHILLMNYQQFNCFFQYATSFRRLFRALKMGGISDIEISDRKKLYNIGYWKARSGESWKVRSHRRRPFLGLLFGSGLWRERRESRQV